MSTPTPRKTTATRNDLPIETRKQVVGLLNQHLADLTDLYTQTKFAHWNIKGMSFIGLHKMFDEFAEIVEKDIDTTAERVTALGFAALGTVRQCAAASQVAEFPIEVNADRAVVEALAERYASVGKSVRVGIDAADELGDADTADLLTDISRNLDMNLYFLEAHLS